MSSPNFGDPYPDPTAGSDASSSPGSVRQPPARADQGLHDTAPEVRDVVTTAAQGFLDLDHTVEDAETDARGLFAPRFIVDSIRDGAERTRQPG